MPYTQIPALRHGPVQTRIDRIVLHGTVSPTRAGQAASAARYLNKVGLSVHYLVDPGGIVQMLAENVVGFHDGHNINEVGIELCDPQAGDPARWSDADHLKMLSLAAPLVRDIANRWSVPKARITANLVGKRGICGHVDVTNTWHESTHVDPDHAGPFPWTRFIDQVNGTDPEDDMTPAQMTAWANSPEGQQALRAAVWQQQIIYSTGPVGVLQEIAHLRYKIAAAVEDPAQLAAEIAKYLPPTPAETANSPEQIEHALQRVLVGADSSNP